MTETATEAPRPTGGCFFEPQRFYSPEDIEAMTGLTTGALAVMRHRGDGPKFTRLGRRIFYKGEAVLAFLDNGIASNTAEAREKARKGGAA